MKVSDAGAPACCNLRAAMMRQLAVLLCGLLLLGCARGEPPAPVIYGENGARSTATSATTTTNTARQARQAPQRQANSADRNASTVRSSGVRVSSLPPTAPRRDAPSFDPRDPRGRAGIHTVARGETVYGIARRYQVPLRAVIDANDLGPPYTLRIGQRLRVPVPRRHVVRKGDTLYGISRAYDVDMHELARINRLRPPYTIKPKQLLIVPGVSGAPEQRSRTTVARAGSGQDSSRTSPADGNATSARTTGPSGNTPEKDRNAERRTANSSDSGDDADESSAGASASVEVTEASVSPPDPKEIPKPPPRASGRFLWPVRGDIVARFGPQDDGLHNDGINIAATRGTTVKAAENGVVAYVGNELRGFGNLLLIKHADGWITAYAHADRILVARGDKVRRGEAIARVGSTGGVARPQLHFEVRQGSRAVDPLKVLGRQQAFVTGN